MFLVSCSPTSETLYENAFNFYRTAGQISISGRDITTKGELEIPAEADGLPVNSICQGGFDNYSEITSVFIQNSMTYIGERAFADCTRLKNIGLSSHLVGIGANAFANTAFYNNKDNWYEDALYIGDYLIKVNASVSGEFRVRDGTKVIASSAFEGCTNIDEVIIPDSVKYIGKDAFLDSGVIENRSEEGALYIGNFLIDVEDGKDNTFVIKEGTTIIADGCFSNCKGVSKIVIPEGVTHIGQYAFWACTNLTEVSIPASTYYIGKNAFTFCNLNKIVVADGNISYTVQDGILYNYPEDTLIRCPQQREGKIELPKGIVNIEESAFWGCELISEIVLPKTLRDIGDGAFYQCYSLEIINFPRNLRNIGKSAFAYCKALKEIQLPKATNIGMDCFLYSGINTKEDLKKEK